MPSASCVKNRALATVTPETMQEANKQWSPLKSISKSVIHEPITDNAVPLPHEGIQVLPRVYLFSHPALPSW